MSISGLVIGPVIPVSNLERSRFFYEEQLGLTGQLAPGGCALRSGAGSVVYLLEGTDYPGQADWPLASFLTEDLEATVAELISRGIDLEQIHDGLAETDSHGIAELEGMRIAWIRDPDHQVLSFFQLAT
jgi:hypothetical protein